MKDNIHDFLEIFDQIKKMGWVESHRSGDTGIGKTFEDLLGKCEDNLSLPDYKGIEIKSKRLASGSLITLFTKAPSDPKKANNYLRETFGSFEDDSGLKTLHTTVNAKSFNTFKNTYGFKIDIDRNTQKLLLVIKDLITNNIVSNEVCWTFNDIKNCLNSKLKWLACVSADEKKQNGSVYFNYTDFELITDLNFENFLSALENGDAFVDIRIGVFHSGKKAGKTHDHGTGFRMYYEKLKQYGTVINSDNIPSTNE